MTSTVLWLVLPKHYTAEAVLTPEMDLQSLSATSSLSSLAAKFGLNANLGATPLPFYTTLVGSRYFLNRLVVMPMKALADNGDTITVTLTALYADSGDDAGDQQEDAVKKTWDRTLTSVDNDANTVAIDYTANDPVLAASVANAYVALINDFNIDERQTQGKALSRFLDKVAVQRAESALAASEDSLTRFYTKNRTFDASPLLKEEEARLQRRINLNEESYTNLVTQLQQAQIQEIQNTPVITVVAPGVPPVKKSSPVLHILLPVALMLAFTVWVVWVAADEYLSGLRASEPTDYARVMTELTSATGVFGRFGQRFWRRQKV